MLSPSLSHWACELMPRITVYSPPVCVLTVSKAPGEGSKCDKHHGLRVNLRWRMRSYSR